jgi:hypothetical protein
LKNILWTLTLVFLLLCFAYLLYKKFFAPSKKCDQCVL